MTEIQYDRNTRSTALERSVKTLPGVFFCIGNNYSVMICTGKCIITVDLINNWKKGKKKKKKNTHNNIVCIKVW